jgi:hypothetical protein
MKYPRRWHSFGLFAVAAVSTVATAEAAVCYLGTNDLLHTAKVFGETQELSDHLDLALANGDFDGDR